MKHIAPPPQTFSACDLPPAASCALWWEGARAGEEKYKADSGPRPQQAAVPTVPIALDGGPRRPDGNPGVELPLRNVERTLRGSGMGWGTRGGSRCLSPGGGQPRYCCRGLESGAAGGRGTFLGLHHHHPSWAGQHIWLEPGPAPPGCGLSERLRSHLPSESVGPEPT